MPGHGWPAPVAGQCSLAAEPIRLGRSAEPFERRAMDGPERIIISGADLVECVVVVDGGAEALEQGGGDAAVDLERDAPQVEAVDEAPPDALPHVVARW